MERSSGDNNPKVREVYLSKAHATIDGNLVPVHDTWRHVVNAK